MSLLIYKRSKCINLYIYLTSKPSDMKNVLKALGATVGFSLFIVVVMWLCQPGNERYLAIGGFIFIGLIVFVCFLLMFISETGIQSKGRPKK